MGTLEGNRYLYLTTPLGEDKLLLSGFTGTEGLNKLFHFDLDLLAENATAVDFDKLIGQKVSFGVQGEVARDMNGIVTEFSQGKRDFNFTQFKMTIVPEVWKLTRKFRSRIFQSINIPDLLRKIFDGFDVAYELQGTYNFREYITQYQETDFAFASRLMEEEGIYYFFKFTRGAHKLVLADTPQSHPDIPGDSKLIFETVEGGERDEERIREWRKAQVWDSGKYTLWDHHFELPHKHLEAAESVQDSVKVGTVPHKLKIAGNENLEVLEHPGRYAQRYDEIRRTGDRYEPELLNIYQDNKQMADLRIQLKEAGMLRIEGMSNCRQITAGHKFTLQRHFDGDGQYVITSVTHEASEGSFRSETGGEGKDHYGNTFTALPFGLPYRPPRVTPLPRISGPLTAVVSGPEGEEIFVDPYGRVQVKFMWDPSDEEEHCSRWIRVATSWAGTSWGNIFIPRMGQEVVVSFSNGDPDLPLITGSVYNAAQMPPYALPQHKTVSTIQTHSTPEGEPIDNYNELRFQDLRGKEQVYFQAARDKDERVNKESREFVGGNRHLFVGASQFESVGGEKNSTVGGSCYSSIGGEQHAIVKKKVVQVYGDGLSRELGGHYQHLCQGDEHRWVLGDRKEAVREGNYSLRLLKGSTFTRNDVGDWMLDCPRGVIAMTGDELSINASLTISLKVGASCISISPSSISISSPMVLINSGPAVAVTAPANFPPLPDPPIRAEEPDAPNIADDGTKFDKM